ncbi:MucR family transcriptional regulator [Azospirillum sp. A1-3]|uniref:MucR family transcriptional regulator n=1 Tax=Azospirillum sp. A1-3 TaxID=185874 RepID=UPI002076EA28|nr:MucR family transcriptional regulator [Azospirillum sp. A1-3]MCM8735355.1 MucR family transcriptional regulator [Azospirillum sp. A1-3]
MSAHADQHEIVALTAKITASYVRGQAIPASALPELIQSVHDALSQAGQQKPIKEERQAPAVPIRRSVAPDAITCLECGKRNRMLKRHLGSEHDLTPDEYRAKWGLPGDYPMTAPNYAAQRSELAKAHGLGRLRSIQPDSESNEPPVAAAPQPSPAKKGRKKSAA